MQPSIRVIVVDDHEMVLYSLARLLDAESGIEVVGTAATSRDAVDLGRRLRPDVAVIDYNLPDANGVTTAREIRRTVADLRVLVLSGEGGDEVLDRAIAADCAGYLEKTRAYSALADAVREVHRGATVMPAGDLVRRLRRGGPTRLTDREREVLRLIAAGRSNKEIARELGLKLNTVRNHVQSVLRKLGAHSKIEALAAAARRQLL